MMSAMVTTEIALGNGDNCNGVTEFILQDHQHSCKIQTSSTAQCKSSTLTVLSRCKCNSCHTNLKVLNMAQSLPRKVKVCFSFALGSQPFKIWTKKTPCICRLMSIHCSFSRECVSIIGLCRSPSETEIEAGVHLNEIKSYMSSVGAKYADIMA